MFIDTNVLVYSRVSGAPEHNAARACLERAAYSGEPVRVSRQILREYLSVVTRPQTWPDRITMEEALADVRRMTDAFHILEDGPRVTETLITLCSEVSVGGRQIHDANIVATMLAHGERRLVTFNVSDFRRYGDRIELLETASP